MEKIDEFYNKIAKNDNLKEKLKQTERDLMNEINFKKKDAIKNKVIPLAKKYGFDFSYEEFLEYERMSAEIGDEELKNISGGLSVCVSVGAGKGCGCYVFGYSKGGCTCPIVGGGSN